MYHINRNGSNHGPYTEAVFQQMLASGQVLPTDLVWKEGDPEWRPASELPGMRHAATPAAPGAPGAYAPPRAAYRPQQASGGYQRGPAPPSYLTQAILVTVLCCIPFGIPAIVYAASVAGKMQAGDYAGAKVASDKAKFWSWMAFGFGLGIGVIYGIIGGIGASHSRF